MEKHIELRTILKITQRIVSKYGNRINVYLIKNENTSSPYNYNPSPDLGIVLECLDDGISDSLGQYVPKLSRSKLGRSSDFSIEIISLLEMPNFMIEAKELAPGVQYLKPRMAYPPFMLQPKYQVKEDGIILYLADGPVIGLSRHSLFKKKEDGYPGEYVKDKEKIARLEAIATKFGDRYGFLKNTLKRVKEIESLHLVPKSKHIKRKLH